jgi:hypothetical protein
VKHTKSPLFLGVSLLASIVFTYFYFLYTHEYPPGSYEKIATYEAHKVFQTRILVTMTANTLEPTLPLLKACFQWIVPYPIGYETLLQLLNSVFLMILLLCMPFLYEILDTRLSPWWAFVLFIPLGWNYIAINGFFDGAGLYYPYDIPSLTFFALGTLLFVHRRWKLFYLFFLVACLNRESACFISLAGFLLTIRFSKSAHTFLQKNRTIILHISSQAALWFASRLTLSYLFRNNPGEFFETPHSMIDFIWLIYTGEPHRWAMVNPRWFLTLFAGIWLIPFLTWKHLSVSSRRFFLQLGTCYIVALAFRSNMMESRVYNELNVIVTACAVVGVHAWWRARQKKTLKVGTYP